MTHRSSPDPVQRLRALCLLLPDAIEKQAWGSPTFRAGEKGKVFAQVESGHGHLSVCLPGTHGDQAILVAADPRRFFVPPYTGPKGWVGVALDDGLDWEQLAVLVSAAYLLVAPRRQAGRLLEAGLQPASLAAQSLEIARALPPPDPPFDPVVRDSLLERLRAICLSLPEVEEKPGPHPAFLVKGKTFLWFLVNHHGDRRLAINCKVGIGAQQALIESEPQRFFLPPYLGAHGWVGVDLKADPDWERVAGLVQESYCMVAPKRFAAEVAGRLRGGELSAMAG